MRRTTLLFVIGLMTLALPLTGCGGSSSFASNSANQDVLSLSPQPFFGAFSLPFTLTGTNFASVATPPGSTVTIRFTATSGTPFLGGTSATVEIPGTVVDPTTIAGDSPLALVSGTVTATVTVVLPSGQEFASTGAIATFVGIQVDSVTPGSAPSEIPTALTVNGDGFGPTGGVAAVRFFVDTGTPFLGGTAAFLDLPGTILSQTAIAIAASPVAGIAADTPVRVRVTLPAGANGASAGPIFTFLAPRVTSAAPSAVFSQLPTLVTLTGSGFGPPAATPTITLRATTGTPFAGGTLDTLSVTGTVVNPTTITFTTPIANVLVAVNPVVEVAFASGAVGTGASGILQIDPAVVTTVAPLLVPADTATPITLTGNGFGPTGACTVTFRADMGTPFLGGTAASISVAGTVVNPTTLTCTTPVTGLANRLLPAIDLIFSTGGGGGSASGLLTFEPRPDAVDDPSYTTVGNVDLTVPAATGVLANDSDPDGDMISVTAFDATGTQGGAVSVAADGSFTYNPPAGFEGTDTFTYTIADPAGLTDSATVTITISDVVWFIDEDATVAGDGRLASPFDTLAAFLASPLDEVDDYIYLYESATTYAGQLTLLDGQQLIGQGVALVVGGSTIVPAAGKPTLGAAGGTALTLASGNTVRGLDLTNTSGQALAGTSVGAFSADTVALDATGGAAIEITTGALSVTFDSITTLNAPSDGIDLVDCTGTFAVTGATAVTGSGNDGINIQGQSAGASTTAFTFSTITINGAAQDGICLNNHDGGFIVTGTTTITDPPAGPSTDYGIDIVDSNPSATWSFGPILISDVVDSGIRARNTVGTNGITFASVGIDRAGQHGIEIANGSAPFTFASLDIDTTGDDGLSISNKGGSLEVTGTAAFANTGNDILTPGADHGVDINGGSCDYTFADLDITDSHGHGVLLTSTTGTFVCSDGDITRPDEMGFSAVTCTGTITLGAAMTGLTIDDAGDALQAGQKSHGMQFDDCTGDIRVEGCVFDDMQEPVGGGSFGDDNNGIHVENADSGTLTNLDIIDCVFRGTVVGISGTTTDHGVNIVLDEASTITNVMIEGCTATGLARSAFQVILDVDDDGDSCTITDLVITQNGDGTTPLETQADAVYIGVHGNSTLTAFRVENNTIDDGSLAAGISAGNGIHVVQGQFGVGTSSTSSATGTISDNTIANTGDSSIDVGIRIVVQEAATGTLAIRDNTVDAAADAGVHVRLFDTASADVTVSGNVLGATTANNQVTGGTIDMLVQTNQTSALCTDINTNDCNDDYRCELLGTSTFELLAIGAGTHTGAQVDTYLGNMTQANVGPTDSLPAGTAVFTECATVATP